jgi:hypothetical protein
MVSLDGIVEMLETNAYTIWVYFSTCASAYMWCSCVNGGGKGFKSIFKNLQKITAWALIMCSSCNIFQLLAIYW